MRGLAVLLMTLGLGCARTDLGAPCHLLSSSNAEVTPLPRQTVVQSGNGECQQFACVSFDGAPAICSQPCTHEGQSCGNNMQCRAAVLDPSLLTQLRARTSGQDTNGNGVDDYEELTAGLTDSLFCGPKP